MITPKRFDPSTRNRKEKTLTSQTTTQNDVYARITAKIMTDLEQGNLTWRKPWNSDHLAGQVLRPLRWNDVPYTGINTLMLWGTAAEQGYTSPYWMTFKQAQDLKANVRKGEKGTQVVYADKMTKEEEDQNGETSTRQIPFLKCYAVFNAQQIDGLSEAFYAKPKSSVVNPVARNETLDRFFAQTKADIYTGTQASYSITTDRVQMPPIESFESAESYYAVLAHEITHWTRHPTRLNRDLGRKHYGDAGYAKEELVAELGACFLAADLGFEPMPESKHAAYIQSWLQALQDDKRFIFQAASHAQRAVEYIHTLQGLAMS
ncbi:zincin-like metallopeptidase domain-containing protein [Spirosoma sp. RP8]|uniref:Zincin-like metallopeptidase domain-containing protein n=1 Tax=Spirosoma liriopis TaxID=2937440 RepID=A0ABT0HHX6_9BACT|nr:zincin-like metallopeptidase domain-containing protein [Spirosoma liriopis]MCK8491760.1 zincin-like metallopeptidase domain-containing protein [Spirosoma liriopis]